jgi:hypothetical protein
VFSEEETLEEFEAIWAKGWSDTIRIVRGWGEIVARRRGDDPARRCRSV